MHLLQFPSHSCALPIAFLMIPMVRVAEQPQDLHLITHPALCAPLTPRPAAVSSDIDCPLTTHTPMARASELTLISPP
jgi:hypothetical protein